MYKSLIDNLNAEIKKCDIEIQKANEIIIQQQERKSCYTERKEILESLIENASQCENITAEPEKATRTKPKPADTTAKRSHKEKPAAGSSADAAVSDSTSPQTVSPVATFSPVGSKDGQSECPENGITMKDLAERLGVATTVIAKACNELSLTIPMGKGGYILSEEQAAQITASVKQSATS